jgi:hypothetical protein
MTWLDWAAVALLVYFVVQGLVKGVGAALLGAAAAILAYVLAAIALPSVGGFLVESTLLPRDLAPEWRRAVGFVATFGLLYLLFMLLISVLPGAKRPSTPTQILGLAGGVVKAAVVCMTLVGIIQASPSPGLVADVERSTLVRHVAALQQRYIQDIRRISPIPFPPVGPDSKF